MLTGAAPEEAEPPDELKALWEVRRAISHSEALHERTRFVGEWLNANGAQRAAAVIKDLSEEVWGSEMPEWFVRGSGLASQRDS